MIWVYVVRFDAPRDVNMFSAPGAVDAFNFL